MSTMLRVRSLSLLVTSFTAVIVALAVHTVWIDLGRPMWGADDALIFFVYARNMVAGHGIVYNVGGPHVEGASSLLYLLICWLAWIFVPQPNVGLLYFNCGLILVSFALIWNVFRRLEKALILPRNSAVLLYATFTACIFANPAFFFWNAVSLMDSEIFSVLIVGGFTVLAVQLTEELSVYHATLLSILIGFTVLARPEGMGWGLLEALAFAIIRYRRARTRSRELRLLLLPSAAFLVTLAALITFRELYFGHALPTTYYAKVTQDHWATLIDGLKYAKRWWTLQYRPSLLLLLLLGAILLGFQFVFRGERSIYLKFLALALVFTTAALLIPIAEGGDHFAGGRLYQPTFPLFCVLAVIVTLPAFRRGYRPGIAAIALIFLFFFLPIHSTWSRYRSESAKVGLWPFTGVNGVRVETEIATYEMANGSLMKEMFSPELPAIGVIPAGGVAYSYQGTVDDLLGLNDEQMARADRIKTGPKDHASFNKDVFYIRSPQIVLPVAFRDPSLSDLEAQYATDLGPESSANTMLKGIYSTPRFQAEYQLAIVQQIAESRLVCYGYFRRDFLQDLLKSGRFQLQQLRDFHP